MNKYPDPEDDDYNESDDEDFTLDKPQAGEDESDSEDETEQRKLDATYAKFQGRGGLIKTRAQRRAEAERGIKPQEDKPQSVVGQSSVDVDALWKEMNGPSTRKEEPAVAKDSAVASEVGAANETTKEARAVKEAKDTTSEEKKAQLKDEMITITRTFKFAGSVRTETKEVPKHSAEGQDFLKQDKLKEELRGRGRPKRKMSLMEEYQMNKTKKINTLEKSRLDWLGFVDKEGIKEDLTKFNKAGYLDKQDFLSRVDTKRESEMRQQRAKSLPK